MSGFTAAIAALEYLLGLAVFGFLFWLLDGIQSEFHSVSEKTTVFQFAIYIWGAAVIIYLIIGAFWLPRKIKEWRQ